MKSNNMNQLVLAFPESVRADINHLFSHGGVLAASQCETICQQLNISFEQLMVALLPIAASFAKPPVSEFKVGAIASGSQLNDKGFANLYLGANFEYVGQALCHSLHAEQAAVSNAWLHGEDSVGHVATSAAPCGHCRQFLYEVSGGKSLLILMPQNGETITQRSYSSAIAQVELTALLPDAFGPLDLGCQQLLMQSLKQSVITPLETQDSLILNAWEAANESYAPYTKNYSGVALQSKDGAVFCGRYAENVAHNPSLVALTAALSQAILSCPSFNLNSLQRVVLVESESLSSQKNISEILTSAISPNLSLEYFKVEVLS
ncbi:cytidine deaminase [Aliikangiella sp. IMCC44653]